MFYFIIFLTFLIVYIRYRYRFVQLINLYKTYKLFVDPQNNLGHIYALKSIFNITLALFQIKTKKQKDPEKFNKKYIKISYKYKDKAYYYLLKVPRGVAPLKSITDENSNDISDIIGPYLGPNLDCHNSDIYPRDFGYNQVKITTVFDKVIVFDEDQKIELTD